MTPRLTRYQAYRFSNRVLTLLVVQLSTSSRILSIELCGYITSTTDEGNNVASGRLHLLDFWSEMLS
ncbi:unnamed protein product [Periconia digitata]|uniref:Uncharacterized protein n=1 Tax=Periconia digitata TaxID=1303443 RepID=A0A9W4XWX4_9PLEO|nr:unnamed protein product [Periconia digitata]